MIFKRKRSFGGSYARQFRERNRKTMFYDFSQNNSGGSFEFSEARGITHHVVIEATSHDHANQRAEGIGIYFDGVDGGNDCECCGDRWGRVSELDGSETPQVYGDPASDYKSSFCKPGAAIHYLDGRIEWSKE